MSLSVVSHVLCNILCVTESYKGVVRPLTTTLLRCVCVGTTLVVFFKECVTEKKKVLNNIRSKEVDGDLLRVMEDDELEEHVGLDGLMVKKLRKKMDGVARDEEAENKVAALITFLEKIHLSQYHDRLVNTMDLHPHPTIFKNPPVSLLCARCRAPPFPLVIRSQRLC